MHMNDDYEPPPEIETSIDCPVCGSKLFMIYYTTNIPYEGKIVINTYVCHKCMYKNPQVFTDNQDKKQRIELSIETPDDLNTLIYRSPKASIVLPDLGTEILPGNESNGEITTVEGILLTIRDRLDLFIDETNAEKVESMKLLLSDLERNTIGMKIIVEDESGKSMIHSSRAVVEYIKKD